MNGNQLTAIAWGHPADLCLVQQPFVIDLIIERILTSARLFQTYDLGIR